MRQLIEKLNARFAAAATGRRVLLVLASALFVFSLFGLWLATLLLAGSAARASGQRASSTTTLRG